MGEREVMIGAIHNADPKVPMAAGELAQMRDVGHPVVVADQKVDRHGHGGQPCVTLGGEQEVLKGLRIGVPRMLQTVEQDRRRYRGSSEARQACRRSGMAAGPTAHPTGSTVAGGKLALEPPEAGDAGAG